ncbi:MAG: hypothetical protein IJR97_09375 [Clostridia bacterium]|nr:hypothetical protein [Clostridia bacterium]
MERYEAFEKMLRDILSRYEREKEAMDDLKARGKEKSATYRQYMGDRLFFSRLIDMYRLYGLIGQEGHDDETGNA